MLAPSPTDARGPIPQIATRRPDFATADSARRASPQAQNPSKRKGHPARPNASTRAEARRARDAQRGRASGEPAGAAEPGPRVGWGGRSRKARSAPARRAACSWEVAVLAGRRLGLARHGRHRGSVVTLPLRGNSANRNLFETARHSFPASCGSAGSPPLPLAADGGSQPHREALRLSAALRERLPQLLLPRPPRDPGDRLRAGGRRDGVARGRPRLRAPGSWSLLTPGRDRRSGP